MSKEYFELAAVMFGIYGFFRIIVWVELRHDFQPLPPSAKQSKMPGHPIDISPLVHRLEDVRRDYAAEARLHPAIKPSLVEQRRAEIARLAFFQKLPPASGSSESDQGLVLLVL